MHCTFAYFLVCVTRVVCCWLLFSLGCFRAARATCVWMCMTLTFDSFPPPPPALWASWAWYAVGDLEPFFFFFFNFKSWPCFMHAEFVMFWRFSWFVFSFSDPPLSVRILILMDGFCIHRWCFSFSEFWQSGMRSHCHFDRRERMVSFVIPSPPLPSL